MDEYEDDYYDDCPCNTCDRECDGWDARYCCTLCMWYARGSEPDCENCDPMDI